MARLYVSLHSELDTGPQGGKRRTPKGSVFEIMGEDSGLFDMVCQKNGAWIRVTPEELEADFTPLAE